ncbi:MAG: hypothetical protein LBR07_05065 [Puniceicoccales bacterium]|jgi:sulfite reductase (NADPH) hemoprotein beta-component|nr:hypothetical protein [Puniceicoccales bacterium]
MTNSAPAAAAAEKEKLSANEILKAESNGLAGTIARTLADPDAEKFDAGDEQLIKFHGLYQQTDRDRRDGPRRHSVMVRTRQTGGVVTAEQYLLYDDLASRFGNGTLRLTTRQTVQIHGVVLGNLRETVRAINEALSTTLATAGDVNRNVIAPPEPRGGAVREQLRADAFTVTKALLPNATAYHEIWLDRRKISEGPYAPDYGAPDIYGPAMLPRKFKIAFAIPPRNDTDLFTNDLGFVAVTTGAPKPKRRTKKAAAKAETKPATEVLAGYDVYAGGGLGMTHGNAATFPRLADYCGRIRRADAVAVARAAVEIHRDFGDRANRRHARLKYLIDERGITWFVAELEARSGVKFARDATPESFATTGDNFGWHLQPGGADSASPRYFLTLPVASGRIADTTGSALKTALRKVVEKWRPAIFLTPSQNIILANLPHRARTEAGVIFLRHGVKLAGAGTGGDAATIARAAANTPATGATGAGAPSPTRLAALACPALPTCPLAITEAERALPEILDALEAELAALGLAGEKINVRITGCPNGCARPYTAEIAFIGRGANKYNIHLGATPAGTALNALWREAVPLAELVPTLRPVLRDFAARRRPAEPFGVFAARTLFEGVV